MIYLNTSVALAHLLAEDRVPADAMWTATLVSSRLLEYELWNRLHAPGSAVTHGDAARELLQRLAFLERALPVHTRALEPFPVVVRTVDALHLASIEFLRAQRQDVALASYDTRMLEAARKLRIPIAEI